MLLDINKGKTNMKVYNFDRGTGEYFGSNDAALDPAETKLQEKDIFLLPANATFIEPPKDSKNKIQVFKDGKWSTKSDFRGTKYYDMNGKQSEITKIGKRIPAGHTTNAPPSNMMKPVWGGMEWQESAPIFLGKLADSKEKVKRIVKQAIADLGEEKAKTLFLLSLKENNTCPEWDDFIDKRHNLLIEADIFITTNTLF
jgi:hypothetical protein